MRRPLYYYKKNKEISGSGVEIVMWGFVLMLAGIPFYIYNHHKNNQ